MKYKFRGYDIIGHKWVYGDLVHNQKVTFTGLTPRTMVGGYEVDPLSVGMFVCFDKNGKEVYSKDVVKTKYGCLCVVEFVVLPNYIGFDLILLESKNRMPDKFDLWIADNIEVVSNIYQSRDFNTFCQKRDI